MSKNMLVICKPWEVFLSADDTNMSFFREDVAHVLLACMTDFVQNMRGKTVQIHMPVVRVGGTHMKLRRLGCHYFKVIIYLHQIWVSHLFGCKLVLRLLKLTAMTTNVNCTKILFGSVLSIRNANTP